MSELVLDLSLYTTTIEGESPELVAQLRTDYDGLNHYSLSLSHVGATFGHADCARVELDPLWQSEVPGWCTTRVRLIVSGQWFDQLPLTFYKGESDMATGIARWPVLFSAPIVMFMLAVRVARVRS